MPNNQWGTARVARELGPLLVSSCRRDADTRLTDEELRILDDAGTRDRFIEYATAHGVLGLALATVARVRPRAGVTGAVLRERLHHARRRAAILELGRDRILAILRSAGLEAVVLKGAALATTVYAEPAERDFGDIDLLLRLDAIDRAMTALGRHGFRVPGAEAVEAGYREHHFHVRVQRHDGIIVELHWEMTGAIEPFHLDAPAFMAESVVAPGALHLRTPRPEHMLLHLVVENVRDGFSRLTRLVDVDRIVAATPDMDWRYLETSARHARLVPSLALVLELSHNVLGTPLPDEVRQRIRPPAAVRFHIALLRPRASMLRQYALTRASWIALLQLWLLSGESRAAALVRMFRGEDVDPLDWIWRRDESPNAPAPVTATPIGRVGKLALYQLWLYARCIAGPPRSWSGTE